MARLVAQSYTGWTNPCTGGPVKTERDGLEPDPPRMQRQSLAAIRHLEQVVPAAPLEGIVLRYGAARSRADSEDSGSRWRVGLGAGHPSPWL